MDPVMCGNYLIRDMVRKDVHHVAQIEFASFTLPWSYYMFLAELEDPYGWARVAVDPNGEVSAYVFCRCYGTAWHIMDIAVHPDHREQGIAGCLLDEILEASIMAGADSTLEVRPSNSAAITLYSGRGFQVVGRRKRYYRDDNEDALVMTHWASPER